MPWVDLEAKKSWESRSLRERMRIQNSVVCPVCVPEGGSMSVDDGWLWVNPGGQTRLIIRGRCAKCSAQLEQYLPI